MWSASALLDIDLRTVAGRQTVEIAVELKTREQMNGSIAICAILGGINGTLLPELSEARSHQDVK
jgi:hypothetical protein